MACGADVSQTVEVRRLVGQATAALGPITILVNNAGISRIQPLEEISEQDWDDVLAVNLKSAFLLTQAVLPGMRAAGWGRILNVSSTAAQTGGVVGPHYASSKAALLGLTHWLASQLAGKRITANALAPAFIATDMTAGIHGFSPERVPVGRLGTTEEAAQVAVALLRNAYVTGQTVQVNGGLYMT